MHNYKKVHINQAQITPARLKTHSNTCRKTGKVKEKTTYKDTSKFLNNMTTTGNSKLKGSDQLHTLDATNVKHHIKTKAINELLCYNTTTTAPYSLGKNFTITVFKSTLFNG